MTVVKFGYLIGQDLSPGQDPAEAVRQAIAEAVEAERAGFSGVFVSEHHQARSAYIPAPIPLMYLLASATARIDVGAAVVLLPLTHPTRVAEEIAVLDHLSEGRVILGVGSGYTSDDFAAFGVDRSQAPSRLEEGVELLRRLWSEPAVDFYGHRYRLRGVSLMPGPRTPGGPPIWIGGRSLPGARRAARIGDAWLMDATPSLSVFRGWYQAYLEVARARGRQPATAVLRDAWVSLGLREDAQYRETMLEATRAKMAAGVYAVDPRMAERRPDEVGFEELAQDRWLVGQPDEIGSQVERWRAELGIHYFLVRFRIRGRPDHALALEQIRAFGELVAGRWAHSPTA